MFITAAGVLTRNELLEDQKRLVKDKHFDPSFSQLADFLQVTKMDITAADVREFAARSSLSPASRRAIVVRDDLAFGFARMFQVFRESKGELDIQVFRNIEQALDWLLSKALPARNSVDLS